MHTHSILLLHVHLLLLVILHALLVPVLLLWVDCGNVELLVAEAGSVKCLKGRKVVITSPITETILN